MNPTVWLNPGREKSVLRRHPWIFSGAIDKVVGTPENGETVKILSSQGEFLAWGAYSPKSQIRVRIWSWDQAQKVGKELFYERLKNSIDRRKALFIPENTNAFRLVYAESDGFPGLIVDQYDTCLVVQFLSAGVEAWRKDILDLLIELTSVERIYERSDVEVRGLEGLPPRTGILYGEDITRPVQILENGMKFLVDIRKGQKTGFFLDQRHNRKIVAEMAGSWKVLDCFCYTYGFVLNTLKAGAQSVIAIDESSDALHLGAENLRINNKSVDLVRPIQADVFQALREFRDRGESFDQIILDPPKFAPTAAQVQRAARGYKDINLLAFKLLKPGGILATFSCSGGLSAELFQKIVADAALDAGRNAVILKQLHQDSDHPIALSFPEGEYLKGLLVTVD